MAKTIVEVDLQVKGTDTVEQAAEKTAKIAEKIKELKDVLKTLPKDSDAFNTISKSIEGLNAKIGKTEAPVKSLKAQLKEMKAQLASGTLDNDAFTALAKKAGELEDRIGDVNAQVKNFASDTRALDGIIGLTEGIVGGFTAIQGITALVGDENEELNKTLVKLQASMAALSGIQAVSNSLNKDSALAVSSLGQAWSKFNNVLKASILGALAAIIIAITYAMANLNKELSVAAIQSEQLSEINLKVAESTAKEKASVQQLLAVAKDENASKKARILAIKELNLLSPEFLGNLKLEKINTDDATKAVELYIESLNKKALAQAFLDKKAELLKQRVETETKALTESLSNTDVIVGSVIQKFQGVGDAAEFGIKKANENRYKELATIDKSIKALDDLQAEYISAGKIIVDTGNAQKFFDEEAEKAREKAKKAREERLAAAKQEAKDTLEAYLQYRDQFAKYSLSAEDYEQLILKQSYEKQRSELERHLLDTKDLTDKYEQERIAASQKYRNEEAAAEEENFMDVLAMLDRQVEASNQLQKEDLERRRFIEDQKFQIARSGIELLESLSGKNKELAAAAFILDKAAAIGSIIVNTQREIAGYYAAYAAIPGGPAIASGLATAATVRAGISIGTIAATAFGKLTASAGGTPTSSGSGSGSSNSALPSSGFFTQQSNVDGLSRQPIRVEVLEKDISEVQERVRRIRQQSILE